MWTGGLSRAGWWLRTVPRAGGCCIEGIASRRHGGDLELKSEVPSRTTSF